MYFKKPLLSLVCALFLFSCSNSKADNQNQVNVLNSPSVSKNAIETQNEFVKVSDKLKDSVVNIRTKKTVYVNYYI